MNQQLARVLDPKQVDDSADPIGKMSIEVPGAWAGCAVALSVPRLLPCGACDGGGCDRCGRSGALRRSADSSEDALLTLPAPLDGPVRVRLVRPFDDDELGILLIDIVPAELPSPSCRRLQAVRVQQPNTSTLPWGVWTLAAGALLLLVLALLAVPRLIAHRGTTLPLSADESPASTQQRRAPDPHAARHRGAAPGVAHGARCAL